ncbi:MAG: 30S ribosomal protein S12 methylthiotransferase RimO [Clostridia bacterium]|nr:30S ribosomal protein S12 methylthiotransferase RimO [Clostridia bacterium]
MNVGFISLGCSKNLVDTEMMIGLFKDNGFQIVNNPKEADIIVVNTCGFIESAKEEAINTLLEMAEYKKNRCKYLVATGCMVERYKKELQKELPEVDLFIKFSEYSTFWKQIVENGISNVDNEKNKTIQPTSRGYVEIKEYNRLDFNQRVVSTGANYAYLRIADGCDNFCTFCAIPYIRGRFKSRKIENILEEAEGLAKKGYRELIIIAQDTTKYGTDIYGETKLAELLNKLSEIKGVEWIRFLYAYPESITDELIEVVKNNDKICKYFDIPMQHCSNRILKSMNRRTTKERMMKLIEKLRKEIPTVIIRSTLMVGFPGETDEDYNELYDFVKWAKFDKLGCFTYSKEEGTSAEKMKNQVHYKTKKSRYDKLMNIQQKISKQNLSKFIGKEFKTLIEDAYVNDDGELYFEGRTYMDVPEIDGYVYIKGSRELQSEIELNTFNKCRITEVKEYDLIGEYIR